MEAFLIVAGVGSVCACVGLVIGSILGANRYAKDMQELTEHHRKLIAEQDKMNAEDVRQLRQAYEAEITALKSRHARDVAHKAAALHAKTCKNIAKRGKERGAITGANA